jgi:thioredoxin reductase (NADPH)
VADDPAEPDELDPTDPYVRSSQTFAHLSPAMVQRLAALGHEERYATDTFVFHQGDRRVDFFVVLEGTIEIVQHDPAGRPSVVVVHGAREFTGDVDMFGDGKVVVSGRASAGTRALRIANTDFRHLLGTEPEIGEIVTRAFILRRVGLIRHSQASTVVIGSGRAADTLRIQRFLGNNAYPFRLVDVDVDPDAEGYKQCAGITRAQLPVVVHGAHEVLQNPDNASLADALGITSEIDETHVYDVVVVGAGPSGLASAVYAASEGLDVLVIEGHAPGGQAGTSSKIENYLGFPTGISGQALAGRAQVQARKFGAKMAISRNVVALECREPDFRLELADGKRVCARAVVIATGARYRKLALDNYDRYEGQGIHYAATAMEEQLCSGRPVAIVGGGNSAGQAAMYLSQRAAHVHILIRGPALAATMSDYLVQRIHASPRITLHTGCEVTEIDGDATLQRIKWRSRETGTEEQHDIENLFVMIGAVPNTDWLRDCVDLDANGFVLCGMRSEAGPAASPYAASLPGIYAVGDVRAGSVKRVASAVGEGSVVVAAIHGYLHPPVS